MRERRAHRAARAVGAAIPGPHIRASSSPALAAPWAWPTFGCFPIAWLSWAGAAFLIPYLIFVALLGFTGVIGEMSFGRLWALALWAHSGRAMEMRGVRHGRAHR